MEGQAEQGRAVLAAAALLSGGTAGAPSLPSEPAATRLLPAVLAFAAVYALLVPGFWLLFLLLLTGTESLRLLASVLFVPLLAALGFVALLRGLLPIGLLLGAVAARMPRQRALRFALAAALPCIDLLVFRLSGLPFLVERLLRLLMDGRALLMLQFGAPVLASLLATALVPERMLARLRGGRRG